MTILDKLKTPQKSDRPIPFWSWNDKLEEDELLRQIALMDEAGIGGFFMHARGGLLTEYMGEEWMRLVEACASEAQRRGMGAWCYDENGWPSGFADGKIVAENPDFAMCGLVCETGKAADEAAKGDEAVLAVKKCQAGAMVVKKVYNPYYVDMLNPDCVKSFIAKTHQQYLKALPGCFDGKIKGFFTDEPQFGNGIYPYSPALEACFQTEYGQSFKDCCHLLFCEEEGFEKARYQYWNAVSNLFLTSFCAQVGAWCEKNGVQLTGHAMAEESLFTQMLTSAGVMGVYAHLHLPGIDHLGRCTASSVTTRQAVSAAVQLGRKKLITETFAMCGHGVSFAELRWIAQSQYVRGVNMMCQHLEGYTMRGARKRDYPPAMFYQQSWWEQYHAFNDYFTRLGMLIRESDDTAGVLVIHPMKSAYITYRHSSQSVAELDESMLQTAAMLDEAHVMWHFGDENMLAGLGRTEGGELWVGEGRYRAVVLPAMYTMDQTTLSLLLNFAKAGGVIFATGPLPGLIGGEKPEAGKSPAALLAPYVREMNLAPYQEVQIKNKNVLAGVRRLGGQTVYHLVNNSKTEAVDEEILLKGAKGVCELNLEEAAQKPAEFSKASEGVTLRLRLAPMESVIYLSGPYESQKRKTPDETVRLDGPFSICAAEENALTLDIFEYRIDGGPWQAEKPLIFLTDELIREKRNCRLSLRCKVCCKGGFWPKNTFLAMENPERFSLFVNGEPINLAPKGFYKDSAFQKIPLEGKIVPGDNEIVLETKFYQSQKVYDVLLGENVLESETNKLTLDTELEPVYLLGDFGVWAEGGTSPGRQGSVRTQKKFYLDETPKTAARCDLTGQGFLFYAGKLTLTQTVRIHKAQRVVLDAGGVCCPCFTVRVNGRDVKTVMWAPYEVDISEFVTEGENEISLVLYASLRNLLGPHHHIDGEPYCVMPASFGKTEPSRDNVWQDGSYFFIPFGFSPEA